MLADRSILSISPFINQPTLHGAIARIYHINKRLCQRNRLLFVCRYTESSIIPTFPDQTILNPGSRPLQLYSPAIFKQMCHAAQEFQCDVVMINQIWSGIHGYLASRKLQLPLAFNQHNVEYLRFKDSKSKIWPVVWLLEKFLCRHSDTILCTSETDRQLFIQNLRVPATKLQVIENGAEVDKLRHHVVDKDKFRVSLGLAPHDSFFLFYGSYTYQPNIDAVHLLVKELIPRWNQMGVQGKIILVGNGTPPVTSYRADDTTDGLELVYSGFVDNLYDYVKSADVILVPLIAGGGTRYKILESIACETPVVSTMIGAEGLNHAACQPLLSVCDGWDTFAQACVDITNQPPTAARTISDEFIKLYDWDHIVQQIDLP